jgi:putative transcriptional regulator
MTNFICNFKKYRQFNELTQEELADKVNVRRETVARLENAKYNPSLELAVRISNVLDTLKNYLSLTLTSH